LSTPVACLRLSLTSTYSAGALALDRQAQTLSVADGAATLPTAPFNETNLSDARYNKLYAQALRTSDCVTRFEIEQEMMQIDYDEGRYIIPYFPPVIGFSANVHGLVPSKTGLSLNSHNFGQVSIGS
jgi:ABC-type transport system substrate-binding protein